MTTEKDPRAGDDERLARARCSLEGLSVGDALGQHVMVYLLKIGSLPGQELPPSPWYFTDDTVPFVLWCVGQYLRSYEQAIQQTLRAGGDLDTTCAMVGGIVVLFGGTESIPLPWRTAREPLPGWPFQRAPA